MINKNKSAKKNLRQILKRKKRNIKRKKQIKTLIKKARVLVSLKDIKEAKNILPQIYKSLDKAVKIGLIKKNTSARKKSKITKIINNLTLNTN